MLPVQTRTADRCKLIPGHHFQSRTLLLSWLLWGHVLPPVCCFVVPSLPTILGVATKPHGPHGGPGRGAVHGPFCQKQDEIPSGSSYSLRDDPRDNGNERKILKAMARLGAPGAGAGLSRDPAVASCSL